MKKTNNGVKSYLAISLVAVSALNSQAAFAQDAEPIDLYHKSLGKECYRTTYPGGRGDGLEGFQGFVGVVEVIVGAAITAGTGGSGVIVGGPVAADGVGRVIGGKCAGLFGVDDVIAMPVLGAVDQLVNLFSKSPKVSTARTKDLSGSDSSGAVSGATEKSFASKGR